MRRGWPSTDELCWRGAGRTSGRQWGTGRQTRHPGDPTVILLGLLLITAGVRAKELGEGSIPGQQLLVGAHLRDLATSHDDDDIHLGQVADAVRDQEPCLWAEWGPAGQCPGDTGNALTPRGPAGQGPGDTGNALTPSQPSSSLSAWDAPICGCLHSTLEPGTGGHWGEKQVPAPHSTVGDKGPTEVQHGARWMSHDQRLCATFLSFWFQGDRRRVGGCDFNKGDGEADLRTTI